MIYWLVAFLIVSALGSLLGLVGIAGDDSLSDGGKFVAMAMKCIMLVWAIVLTVVFLTK